MPTAINKQRVLTQLFTALRKRYEGAEPEPRPVMEQFIYAICREGVTREEADLAFKKLRERFYDWNEVRVSSPREVEEALADLPRSASRADRIVSFLQEVFETTFSFELENLEKKGLKQAAKQLSRFQAASDYAVAWVLQQSLAGHAIPVDGPTMRVLRRLGLIEDGEADLEALRASLEHLVPKARGPLFNDLISALADDLCVERDPECPSCPLLSECPTGQELVSAASQPAPRSRVKPR
jgi:endonuclease III